MTKARGHGSRGATAYAVADGAERWSLIVSSFSYGGRDCEGVTGVMVYGLRSRKNTAEITPRFAVCPNLAP